MVVGKHYVINKWTRGKRVRHQFTGFEHPGNSGSKLRPEQRKCLESTCTNANSFIQQFQIHIIHIWLH